MKGVFDPPKLVEYVHKRIGKCAVIVKQEPAEKKEGEEKGKESKEGKKDGDAEGDKEKKGGEQEDNKEKKEGGGDNGEEAAKPDDAQTEEITKIIELKKNEYYFYPPRYAAMELHPYQYPYPYPPQIFSDENPNACSVM